MGVGNPTIGKSLDNKKVTKFEPGVTVHVYNPSGRETEAGGSL